MGVVISVKFTSKCEISKSVSCLAEWLTPKQFRAITVFKTRLWNSKNTLQTADRTTEIEPL